MKRLTLTLTLALLGAVGCWAQQAAPITTSQLTFTANAPNPAPPSVVNATRVGTAGPNTYYYWVTSELLIGWSTPSSPALVTSSNGTLDTNNYNRVTWNPVPGAIEYQVLRTTSNVQPAPGCMCATTGGATSSTSFNDQSNTLGAYSNSPWSGDSSIVANNLVTAAGTTQLQLNFGGTRKGYVPVATGSPVAGNCVEWAAVTTVEDAGAPCGSGGGGVTLQTNGTNNSSQTLLNLVAGSNVTLSNTSGGNVSIASSGGGTLPVVLPETYGAKGDGAYYFDGAITAATNVASGSSAAPATPAIATAIDGSVVNYIWQTNADWSAAPNTGTQQIAVAYSSGTYGLTVNDQTIATAADVASATGTTSSTQSWQAAAIVLAPSGTITLVGTPTSVKSSSSSIVVNVPSGAVEGDTLTGTVATYGPGISWPAGWTVLFSVQDSSGNHLSAAYIKLGASPPSSYTWANAGGSASIGVIAYANVADAYALSTLRSATAGFTAAAVGDPICTAATAADGKGEQCGIIGGYISSTEAFVSYVAGSTPDNIWFGYGTNDSAAFTTMLSSAPCSTVGCRIQLGPYGYALASSYTLPPNIAIQVQGAGAGVPNTPNSYISPTIPPNANTGSRLMFLTQGLTRAAITIGGTSGVTSTAAWDQIADVGILAGAGRGYDGGGADGIDILDWQGVALNRVIVSNFTGRGVYADGIVESGTDYIEAVAFNQLYTIYNGAAGRQIGSSNGVSNLETISDSNGVSEYNGGPGIKLQGNVQGYEARDNVIQWNNWASLTGASELEIDNYLAGGCTIIDNYFEVDDGDAHAITPDIAGCLVYNYIAGTGSGESKKLGVNTTSPTATVTAAGGIASTPYAVPYSTTPVLDLDASGVQQFACTSGGASIAPTVTNPVAGELFTVIFVQNGTTACTWTWPSAIHGGGTVTTTLNGISAQQFIVSANGTDAYATSAMQSTTGGTP